MKKVISFGDSFTAGLGVDRNTEEKILGNHPNWKHMNQEQKHKQREIANKFRADNSFTKFFSDNYNVDFKNLGEIGCNNKRILNQIFNYDDVHGFEVGDFVIIGWTSSMRDKLPFFPSLFNDNIMSGLTWSVKELPLIVSGRQKISFSDETQRKKWEPFWKEYIKKYITELYDERYFEVYNINLISLVQSFLDYKKIDYIMFDAFESMLQKSHSSINTEKYWGFGKKTFSSYVESFNDESLLELDGYNLNDVIAKHPSKTGHELFTKELIKFYDKRT